MKEKSEKITRANKRYLPKGYSIKFDKGQGFTDNFELTQYEKKIISFWVKKAFFSKTKLYESTILPVSDRVELDFIGYNENYKDVLICKYNKKHFNL